MATNSPAKRRDKPARYQLWIPRELQPLFGGKKSLNKVLSDVAPRDVARTKRAMQVRDEQRFYELGRLPAERKAAIIAAGGIDKLPARVAVLEGHLAFSAGVDKAIAALPQGIRSDTFHDESGPPPVSWAVIEESYVAAQELAQAQKESRAELETLQPIALQASPAAAYTWEGLYALWLNKGCKRTRCHVRTRNLLKQHFGNVDFRTVTRAQMHSFRKWLGSEGIALSSQVSIMSAAKGMFSRAARNGDMPDDLNPAHGVHVDVPNVVPRDGFTGSQLATILRKAEETKFGGERHVEISWMLRLAVYSGLRINEIAQLRKDDVGVAKIGDRDIPFLHIREGVGQSLKGSPSRPAVARKVPLHPAVQDFVAYAKASPTDFIFEAFPRNPTNGRAYWLIGNFGAFKRETCEITEGKLTLHSLRKSFHRAMSDARLHSDSQRYLVGHAGKDTHDRNYNDTQGLGLLAEEIARVKPLGIEG